MPSRRRMRLRTGTHRISGCLPPPDDYRGPYRRGEPGLAEAYAAMADAPIAALREAGFGLAAFMIDSAFMTNGILDVAPGYLQAVVDRVRAAGGLFIADEVQSGFGRMGTALLGPPASWRGAGLHHHRQAGGQRISGRCGHHPARDPRELPQERAVLLHLRRQQCRLRGGDRGARRDPRRRAGRECPRHRRLFPRRAPQA